LNAVDLCGTCAERGVDDFANIGDSPDFDSQSIAYDEPGRLALPVVVDPDGIAGGVDLCGVDTCGSDRGDRPVKSCSVVCSCDVRGR
jgi:hypothetical protein